MNLENVTRDDWIVGGLALVLAIFLLVLPWFDISVRGAVLGHPRTATRRSRRVAWHPRRSSRRSRWSPIWRSSVCRRRPRCPAIGDSRTNTRFVLAVVAAGFVALKFLFHIHFRPVRLGLLRQRHHHRGARVRRATRRARARDRLGAVSASTRSAPRPSAAPPTAAERPRAASSREPARRGRPTPAGGRQARRRLPDSRTAAVDTGHIAGAAWISIRRGSDKEN